MLRPLSFILIFIGTTIFVLPLGLAAYIYLQLPAEGPDTGAGMVAVLLLLLGYLVMTIFHAAGGALFYLSWRKAGKWMGTRDKVLIYVALACQVLPLIAWSLRAAVNFA